ncbi:MAG: toxin-antitoxin system YwqK family antitoxin [Woeseiaceae bacterium]
MIRMLHLGTIIAIQIAVAQSTLAETAPISPDRIVVKDFLVYQVGSNDPYTGLVISTRYDGSKDYEEHYVSGQLHGARTSWDRGDIRISETTYVSGAKTGPESFWYSNGQIMAVTNMLNGGRHGTSTRWCKDGQKRFEWSYADNMKNGLQVAWYPNGQKQSESIYKNDRASGRLTRWYENGQLRSDVNADRVRKSITSTSWYESGQIQCEAVMAEGRPRTRKAWDDDGNLLELGEQEFLAHCNSWLGSAMPRSGEHIVSVRGDLNSATRYGTVGNTTTETAIKVSAAERERLLSRGKSVLECGLPREHTF